MFIILIVCNFPFLAFAELQRILVYENENIASSDYTVLKMYVINNSSLPLTFSPNLEIKGELRSKNKRAEAVIPIRMVLLNNNEDLQQSEIKEGQTRQLNYRVDFPAHLIGLYSLSLLDGSSNSVLILIEENQLAMNKAVTSPKMMSEPSIDQNMQTSRTIEDNSSNFLTNFSGSDPIYFIYGGNQSDAKFQLSFKYRLIDQEGSIARYAPWVSGLHLGYTQTAFWNLSSESSPFSDTIFQPSFFYEKHFENINFISSDAHASIAGGIEHQSNGKGGLDSKSLNFFYVEPSITYPLFNDLELDLKFRVLTYVGDLSDNPDIRDFRGNGSISIGIGDPEALMFNSEIRGNISTGKGNLVFDISYPLDKLLYNNLDLYLFGQLYSGYGESLINYNQKDTSVRFGIALHR